MKRETFSTVTQMKKESRFIIGMVPSTTRIPHKNKVKRHPKHRKQEVNE